MNRKLIESKFLDLIEGRLSAEEAQQLKSQISADPQLATNFKQYQELINIEHLIAEKEIELSENFTVKVMQQLESTSRALFWSSFMRFITTRHFASAGLATFALALLIFKVTTGGLKEQIEDKQATYLPAEIDSSERSKHSANSGPTKLEISKDSLATGYGGKETNKEENSDGQTNNNLIQEAPVAGADLKAKGVNEKKTDENLKIELSKSVPAIAPLQRQLNEQSANILVEPESFATGAIFTAPVPAFNQSAKYGQYLENPRNAVSAEPVSTFSIDVDTGSYTNARRFIRLGQMPPADSIRTEEFLNYFKFDYPTQTKEPFAVYSEIAPSPLEPKKYLLKLGVKTKDIEESTKTWNLVFLVDVSGSMQSNDKIGLLKQALKVLVNNMRSKDKISIVTYAGSAGTLLEAAGIEQKQEILSKIEALTAGGSTNGSGGILEAYRIAQKHYQSNNENRVILASDGDFNVGVTSTQELIKLIEDKRKAGVTLTTLGFGTDNYNEELTEQLANKGNGNYFYIDSFNEARKVFETDLFSTIETVAKDVKIQIEFNPQHVSSYRLIGYDNRKLKREDFNNDLIDAGETGSGHTVTAIYELALKGSEFEKELSSELRYSDNKEKLLQSDKLNPELAFLKIRYKEPTASESKLLSFPILRQDVKQSADNASTDFRFASSVSYFAHLLRNSQFKGTYSYKDIASLAKQNMGQDQLGYRREFVELVESVAILSK